MSDSNRVLSFSGKLNPERTGRADTLQTRTVREEKMGIGPNIQNLTKESQGQILLQGGGQGHRRGSTNIETGGLFQGLLCTEDLTKTDTAHDLETGSATDLHHETGSGKDQGQEIGQGAPEAARGRRSETGIKIPKMFTPRQRKEKNLQPKPNHRLLQSERPVL